MTKAGKNPKTTQIVPPVSSGPMPNDIPRNAPPNATTSAPAIKRNGARKSQRAHDGKGRLPLGKLCMCRRQSSFDGFGNSMCAKSPNSIIHPNSADRPGLRFWVSWRNLYAGNHPCQSFTGKGLDQVWPLIPGRQPAFVACHIGAIKDKVGLSLAKPIYE